MVLLMEMSSLTVEISVCGSAHLLTGFCSFSLATDYTVISFPFFFG